MNGWLPESYPWDYKEDLFLAHHKNQIQTKSSSTINSQGSSLPLLGSGETSILGNYPIPAHRESYRLAINHLIKNGRDAYHEFLKEERIGSFLSDEEMLFITANAEQPPSQDTTEGVTGPADTESSSGTYWPTETEVEAPDLDMGWPEIFYSNKNTEIEMFYSPPRPGDPSIKEVIRKHIQDAKMFIAIAMDKFTDIDILNELVDASFRNVSVYLVLDEFHLKDFLKMVENQNVSIPLLKNMRVRTVKGRDYHCGSGAKFHGAMKQTFLLLDCQTVIYGSYSFTWSFERIHRSMIQVLKGKAVKEYDDEFRTLYGVSALPAELTPAESVLWSKGLQEKTMSAHSNSLLTDVRRDQPIMDGIGMSWKATERRPSFEGEGKMLKPVMENNSGIHMKMPQFKQYGLAERMNLIKRHSYAGERQDGFFSQYPKPKGSNWNVSRDAGIGLNNYFEDNYIQMPRVHRNVNLRNGYYFDDKNMFCMRRSMNMPKMEGKSKAIRTMRQENVKNLDSSFPRSSDYLDQFEIQDKSISMQNRMRRSLVLRSAIPEQMEALKHAPTGFSTSGTPNAHLLYSSKGRVQRETAVDRTSPHDLTSRRPIGQQLGGLNGLAGCYGPGGPLVNPVYASLGRNKHEKVVTNPDMDRDNWFKRHSLAERHTDSDDLFASSSHMNVPFMKTQINRSTAEISPQNGLHGSNLSEDQRSLSQYDVKGINVLRVMSSNMWQEPPSRSLSAAVLEQNNQNPTGTPASSKKIKSFLDIPEKRDEPNRLLETPSPLSCESTDTLTLDDTGQGRTTPKESTPPQSKHSPVRSSSERHVNSNPRTKAEDRKLSLAPSHSKTPAQKSSRLGTENPPSSRLDPHCAPEKKTSHFGLKRSPSQGKGRSSSRGAAEKNSIQAKQGQGENKLEKLFQRMGNFMRKK